MTSIRASRLSGHSTSKCNFPVFRSSATQTPKIIFGSETAVQARLAASTVSQTINTSVVERNNLTCRQCNGRLSRKVLSFSKDLTWLEKHLWLSLAYYHFVLPHESLRYPCPEPHPTRGSGSPKK